MNEQTRERPWYNPNISNAVLQWIGAIMSLFSIFTACLTIAGVLQNKQFAWAILFISIFGFVGPYAFFVDELKWRRATCIFALVVFVLAVMQIMDIFTQLGF
jgi:hypothetical protein